MNHTLADLPVLHQYTMVIATYTSMRNRIIVVMATPFSFITTLLKQHCLTSMDVTLTIILIVLVIRLLVLVQFSIDLFRRTTRDKIKVSKCVLSATRPSKVASSGRQV